MTARANAANTSIITNGLRKTALQNDIKPERLPRFELQSVIGGNDNEAFERMKTKLCKKCGVEKPLDEMVKNKGCKHGIEHLCKSCRIKRLSGYKGIYIKKGLTAEGRKRKQFGQKLCVACNCHFTATRYNSKFCSKNCCKKFLRREHYTRNQDEENRRAVHWYYEHKNNANQIASIKNRRRRACDTLSDSYIKGLLKAKGITYRHLGLIELHRVHVKGKRLIKQLS